MITIEQLDKVLEQAQLSILAPEDKGPTHFERSRKFVIDGLEYRIEWWSNISYLYVGMLCIPFDEMWIDNNSPRRHLSKMDLRFGYRGESYHGILNLVDWEDKQ